MICNQMAILHQAAPTVPSDFFVSPSLRLFSYNYIFFFPHVLTNNFLWEFNSYTGLYSEIHALLKTDLKDLARCDIQCQLWTKSKFGTNFNCGKIRRQVPYHLHIARESESLLNV